MIQVHFVAEMCLSVVFPKKKGMFWGETFFFPNEIISSYGGEVGFDVGIHASGYTRKIVLR